MQKLVNISSDQVSLEGELVLPEDTSSIVLFAHGSGSSRFSPRNNYVASILQKAGIGTLLFDLLTREEDRNYDTAPACGNHLGQTGAVNPILQHRLLRRQHRRSRCFAGSGRNEWGNLGSGIPRWASRSGWAGRAG